MSSEREAIRHKILDAALALAPFEGWHGQLLAHAARDAGLAALEGKRVFPGGISELLNFYNQVTDEAMTARIAREVAYPTLKIREKIAYGVRARLEIMAPHREAIRRALAAGLLPTHWPGTGQALWQTLDRIWRLAGDQSTDFNYYTKRALLGNVYGSTVLFWMNDESEGHADSWAFLARRIDDVMRFGKWQADMKAKCKASLAKTGRIWQDWRPQRTG